ncbi:MAG: hypothetical protein J0M15_02295 [Deltaproteobacteria bacterium]|jgi:hypothetical protein|nr:hypothetical protein [Deltaproteobacteria bacterium]
MNYLNKFLLAISLIFSMNALATDDFIDYATDHLTVSYPYDNQVIKLNIGLGKENGYRITCSGFAFFNNTTANLWVHNGLGKNPKDINLTSGILVSTIKNISSSDCKYLKYLLASATSENPVVINFARNSPFSISNSK